MEKAEFNRLLEEEKILYLGADAKGQREMKKTRHKRYMIYKCLYYFRYSQYWREILQNAGNPVRKALANILLRRYKKLRNLYTEKSGVEIGIDSVVGRNCDIWHGGVVINGTVGDNCVFHGNNIVGNKGLGRATDRPTIGNNVDIGAGAIVIGSVEIADGCIIGAGAVVTKSFDRPDSVLVGVPAKIAVEIDK